ncbi:MAG: hypothetical protein ACRCYZ_06445 [Alphaproteobacteria bacterium]
MVPGIAYLKIGIKMNRFLYSCFLFFSLVTSVNVSAASNKPVLCESFEFLNSEQIKIFRDSVSFSSSKALYENKKNHRKGKKLLLNILKKTDHPDHEKAVNYAANSLNKKFLKALEEIIINFSGKAGSYYFDAMRTLYESEKNHQRGKELFLKILKKTDHPEYEMSVNYAGDSLSKTLRAAAKKALKNIFGEAGSLNFLEKSYGYFNQSDGSFLYLEALENLVCLASNPIFFFEKRTKLYAFLAMKILQEKDMCPKGSFGEFFIKEGRSLRITRHTELRKKAIWYR